MKSSTLCSLCAFYVKVLPVYRRPTKIRSHPPRYRTRALSHRGGFTRASHRNRVISDAHPTGIDKFGRAPCAARRAHPVNVAKERATAKTPNRFITHRPKIKATSSKLMAPKDAHVGLKAPPCASSVPSVLKIVSSHIKRTKARDVVLAPRYEVPH